MNPWEKGFLGLTALQTAALLVKLWMNGLARIYRVFFCYLASDLLSSIAAMAIPFDTNLYVRSYFFFQTLKFAIASFVLMEIYSLALEGTPALAAFGRKTVGYFLGAAAVLPMAFVLVDHSRSAHPYLRTFFLVEQTLDATIAIFLILISIFLAWFPVRMRRNVVVYLIGFVIWSLSRSALVHLMNQWSGNTRAMTFINTVEICVPIGCLLFWLTGLRREGEARTAVVGHLWNRAEVERLTSQLDAINNSLERMRHRRTTALD